MDWAHNVTLSFTTVLEQAMHRKKTFLVKWTRVLREAPKQLVGRVSVISVQWRLKMSPVVIIYLGVETLFPEFCNWLCVVRGLVEGSGLPFSRCLFCLKNWFFMRKHCLNLKWKSPFISRLSSCRHWP